MLTVYEPGGSKVAEKRPSPVVTTVRSTFFVASLMMVTVAPLTTAPLGSVTAPEIAPDCEPWGRAAPASKSSDSSKMTDRARIVLISLKPPPKKQNFWPKRKRFGQKQSWSKLLTCNRQ